MWIIHVLLTYFQRIFNVLSETRRKRVENGGKNTFLIGIQSLNKSQNYWNDFCREKFIHNLRIITRNKLIVKELKTLFTFKNISLWKN